MHSNHRAILRWLTERVCLATDPTTLWQLLLADDGTINHRSAGLIDDTDAFDAALFGITPREAEAMDPRGQAGSNTGVHVGVIKGNLGPAESAAGIVGLIKVVLGLHHRTEPAKNEYVAASSFGIGGTDCHVALADPPVTQTDADPPEWGVLTLSAESPDALRRNAAQLADDLENSTAPLSQLCWSTNRTKALGKTRLTFVTDDRDAAAAELRYAELEFGVAGPVSMGWLFSGQGTQYPSMRIELYEDSAVFRDVFDRVETAMLPHLGVLIRDVMGDGRIHRTEFAQPAIFALQYAQAQALVELGAEPAWLLGHGIGEFAAAAVAKVFSLDDACRLVAARGELMQRLPDGGSMLAVRARFGGIPVFPIDLAAVNGPEEIVLSGPAAAIDKAAQTLADAGIGARRLNVSHAFHSRLMDPITAEFAAIATEGTYRMPRLPIFSTVHGGMLDEAQPMDARYWTAHLGATVRFADAVDAALQTEPTHLVEFGSRPTLAPMIARAGYAPLPTLNVAAGVTETATALYREGLDLNWDLLYPEQARVPVRLSG